MKTLPLIALVALAVAAPAAAQQTDAERRIEENLRAMEVHRQLEQIRALEQRLDDLELRRRTEENIRQFDIQLSRAPVIPSVILDPPPALAPLTPAQVLELERRRQAALEASNQRLLKLADEVNNPSK